MAKALWDKPIPSKHDDWAGGPNTDFNPVSGKYVQQFIKETLDKKFGWLHYEKADKKYFVFSDQEDYNTWVKNKVSNANLILAKFDAPEPAKISTFTMSNEDVTLLFGETIPSLVFNYYIADNSDNPFAEPVIAKIAVTSSAGVVRSETVTIPIDPVRYKYTVQDYIALGGKIGNEYSAKFGETDNTKVGNRYEYSSANLSRLMPNADNYTVLVTLTGSTTQVSTNLVFSYKLVSLSINTDFDNLQEVDYSNTSFTQNLKITGADGFPKTLEIYLDGQEFHQNTVSTGITNVNRLFEHGSVLTNSNVPLELFMRKPDGSPILWTGETNPLNGKEMFSPGKHNLQIRTFIAIDASTRISSQTIMCDFVIASADEQDTYLLYNAKVSDIRDINEPIVLNGMQYQTIDYSIGVLSTTNLSEIDVKYQYYKEVNVAVIDPNTGNPITDDNGQVVTEIGKEAIGDPIELTIGNKQTQTTSYLLRDAGVLYVEISSPSVDDVIEIKILSENSGINIHETTDGNIFKFSAENNSNSMKNNNIWKNTAATENSAYTEVVGTLNDVLFDSANDGWQNNALVLRNGATVSFPINLFACGTKSIPVNGFTFEIDFETTNVQSEDAEILRYSDANNKSEIVITTTSASIVSQKGTRLLTNYKDGERIKLAFIVNPIKSTNEVSDTNDNPNTMFIMVNGVLDRVARYGNGNDPTSDTFEWTGTTQTGFSIGNLDGKAGVKLYSLRIYDKALTLDEEFMNYMNDQSGETLMDVYKKNDVFTSNGEEVSYEKVSKMIPTLTLSFDWITLSGKTSKEKKANTFAEALFVDPTNESLGFYARQCWLSCQGTSSMAYPIKNLRLYFGKSWNKKTFQEIKKIEKANGDGIEVVTANAEDINTTPEYETEFWPYSEYGSENLSNIRNWADEHLPYATNKKVDGPDGSEIRVNGQKVRAIHEGFHKIGANRTDAAKVQIILNYLNNEQPTKVNENGEIQYGPVSLFMVNPPAGQIFGSGDNAYEPHKEFLADTPFADSINQGKPVYVKNAFNKNSTVYSCEKLMGWISDDDKSFDMSPNKYQENAYSSFIKLDNSKLNESVLTDIVKKYDIFISAYTPLIRKGETLGSASYKKYIEELRWSGVKLYTAKNIDKNSYKNSKDPVNANVLYYGLGANWRQYDETNHASGWTDRWTLKADYAESSMCHNSGIGRLWGNALKNFNYNGDYPGYTNAQKFVSVGPSPIDIRTSCDGKPILLFYEQIRRFGIDGKPVYDDRKFGGLYNIMTDKSSTKLFGFEDITTPFANPADESGKPLKWSASKTECWECLNNGSDIVKGLTTVYDVKGPDGNALGYSENSGNIGKGDVDEEPGREIWRSYEARWPDTGQERHEYDPSDLPDPVKGKLGEGSLGNLWPDDTYGVDTTNLENYLRWLNFCRPAVEYKIGEGENVIDGYKQELYIEIDSPLTATAMYDAYVAAKALYDAGNFNTKSKEQLEIEIKNNTLYHKWDKFGNTMYSPIGDSYEDYIPRVDDEGEPILDEQDNPTYDVRQIPIEWNVNNRWYSYKWAVDMEKVTKTISNEKIGKRVYIIDTDSFDSTYRCVRNGEIDEELAKKYKIKTYATEVVGKKDTLEYTDNYGQKIEINVNSATFDGEPINMDEDEHKVSIDGGASYVSCKNLTYMQYFKATKWDHLNVYRVAAYYIYVIRFGAVDQVIKNTMMTTEDGQYWYFINYDNDTILGVRNDGKLVYNWDFDRNSYDASLPAYAFAGADSVLWNNLEMDDEFMSIVKDIDKEMSSAGLLSAEAVLTMLNEKQEGVWCERLYNEQEKMKYLSTVKENFDNDKYLAFMHGTRHSHRTWWVNNRWNLYDAKWGTGQYSLKRWDFKFMIADASISNPQNLVAITAASKYYFTIVKNNDTLSGGFKEINGDETKVFSLTESSQIGDPYYIWGAPKIKVLNLRPNAQKVSEITLNDQYKIVKSDGSAHTLYWTETDGTMMTKLLLGYGDDPWSNEAAEDAKRFDIVGLNKYYSLEELDIRGVRNFRSAAPSIDALPNLHRYRAKASNTSLFHPMAGTTFYELSLPESVTEIYLDRVTFMADPYLDKYESYQKAMVSSVESENRGEAPAGYTPFGLKFGDILPEYTNYSAYKYCKTYDAETNELVWHAQQVTEETYTGEYQFDYTPSINLRKLTLDNVKGLDTYQLLLDWKAALAEVNTKERNVSIKGFEWVIEDDQDYDPSNASGGKSAVDKFIEMYNTFTYSSFTGNVYLKHKNDTPLTEAEYNYLIEVFGTSDIFKSSNPLTISGASTMFMSVEGGEKHENELSGQQFNNSTCYHLVQGNKFTVSAAVFPVSETWDYVYVLKSTNTLSGVSLTNDGEKGRETFYVNTMSGETAMTLVNRDGKATFNVDPSFNIGLQDNDYFEIRVCGYNKRTGAIDETNELTNTYKNRIYVKVIKQSMPAKADVVAYDVTNPADKTKVSFDTDATKSEMIKGDVRTFALTYKNGVHSNVKVESINLYFNTPGTYAIGRQDTDGTFIEKVKLIPNADNTYVNIDNENEMFTFNIQHTIAECISNPNVKLHADIKFENGTTYQMLFDYNVVCKYVQDNSGIRIKKISKVNDNYIIEQESLNNLLIETIGIHRFKVELDEHNINYDITMAVQSPNGVEIEYVKHDDITGIDDVIVVTADTETSIIQTNPLRIEIEPEVEVENTIEILEKVFDYNINIAYPDNFELGYHITVENEAQYVNSNLKTYSNNFDLNLTDGSFFQGELNFIVTSTESKEAVKMPYAVKINTIQLDDNEPKNFVDGISIQDYSADGNTGTVTFSLTEKNVEFGDETVNSAEKLTVVTNALSGINSTHTITLSCSVVYDNDLSDDNPRRNFMFDTNDSDGLSDSVKFTMIISRSLCSATTWTKTEAIDTTANVYTLYVVSKDNKYFKLPVKNDFTIDNTEIDKLKESNTGISATDWKGIGFRTSGTSFGYSTDGTANGKSWPIYVSLYRYVNYYFNDNNSDINNISLNRISVDNKYLNTSLFNGSEITKHLASIDSLSMFATLNEDSLYVPSMAEIAKLYNIGQTTYSENVPMTNEARALNAAFEALRNVIMPVYLKMNNDCGFVYSENANVANIAGLDLTKHFLFFNNLNELRTIRYTSSTIYSNRYQENRIPTVFNSTYTRRDNTGTFYGSISQFGQDSSINLASTLAITIPFVKVK